MPNAQVVAHTLKSVRKHFIDLSLPRLPGADEESFVIRLTKDGLHDLELSPADFVQFINVLTDARDKIMGGQPSFLDNANVRSAIADAIRSSAETDNDDQVAESVLAALRKVLR